MNCAVRISNKYTINLASHTKKIYIIVIYIVYIVHSAHDDIYPLHTTNSINIKFAARFKYYRTSVLFSGLGNRTIYINEKMFCTDET